MTGVRRADRPPVPWRMGDLLLLCLTTTAGLLLILVAWFQASNALTLQAQVAWLNTGVAGVIVAGAGNVVWLLTGRRSVGELGRRLTPQLEVRPNATGRTRASPSRPTTGPRLVAGPTMTRYHRGDCPLVVGKRVRAAREDRHTGQGRRPCDICLREQA